METIAVILVSDVLLGMGRKSWINHFGDFRVLFQIFSGRHGIFALLLHPKSHSFCCLQYHESSEWIHDVTMNVLYPLDSVCKLSGLGNNSTSCHHVVTFVILC